MQGAWTAGRTAPDARLQVLPTEVAALPALPPSFRVALDRGLAVLGVALRDDARAAIDGHVRLLLAWNEAINLTAITDPAEVATRHVVDSLTAVPLLAGGGSGGVPVQLLDIGSGGGFPGLTLAAAIPGAEVTLADSVAKKARFLEVAARAAALGDRVRVAAVRAEALAAGHRRWTVVTARAVGSLPDLVELALPLLELGGRLIAWKRGDLAAELVGASRAADALGGDAPVAHPVAGPPELVGHVLVEVVKRRPTPAGYPRDPARRKREPW